MEIDYEKLKELDIKNDGKKKQFCPECHANRTDKRDKSLSVDWEKCIAHCHYCGKNFFFGKRRGTPRGCPDTSTESSVESSLRKQGTRKGCPYTSQSPWK